jgi:predicted MFS family arabinose efflux permease
MGIYHVERWHPQPNELPAYELPRPRNESTQTNSTLVSDQFSVPRTQSTQTTSTLVTDVFSAPHNKGTQAVLSDQSSVTRRASTVSNDASSSLPPPATTKQAWLQVLVNHLIMANSFGLIRSFGIFQLPYEDLLDTDPSTVAWIGSTHVFFVYFLGTFSGWALDRGYYKRMLFMGSILQIIGLLVAGFSTSWGVTFVFHGVFQGIGHGLMFCPAVTTTALYFRDSKSKTMALGIAGCGASTGGILFPLIARYTLDTRGVGFTLWVMCGVVAAVSVVIQLLARTGPGRPSQHGNKKQVFVQWRAFKEPTYALYVLAMFFVFMGTLIPFFYVREFSGAALHVSKSTSFVVLIALNAAGIPGRIIPALLSDRCIGTINTYVILLLFTSATLLCWPFVRTTTGMIPWVIAYGFCAGGVSSLLQAGITSLNGEPEKTGIKIGMAFSVVGFASLVGAPVGGELIKIGEETREEGPEQYFWMMVFTGTITLLGCGILCAARGEKTRYKFWVKV